MSEPILEFLMNSTVTFVIVIVTGALIVLGLLFEIVWHVRQTMKSNSKGPVTEDVVAETPKRKEGVAMSMIDPKWVSAPIAEIKNEMRSFHERMNKLEGDINVMKEAMVKITESFHQRR